MTEKTFSLFHPCRITYIQVDHIFDLLWLVACLSGRNFDLRNNLPKSSNQMEKEAMNRQSDTVLTVCWNLEVGRLTDQV